MQNVEEAHIETHLKNRIKERTDFYAAKVYFMSTHTCPSSELYGICQRRKLYR